MPTERREGGDIPLTPQPAVSSPMAETLISTLSPHSSVVLEPEAQVRDWTETEQRPALTCGLIVERAQQQEQHFYQVGVKISPDMVLYTIVAINSKPKQQFESFLGKQIQSVSGAVRRVSMALHHGCSRDAGGQGPWATVSAGVLILQEPALSIPCPAVGRARIKRGSSQQPVW